MRHWMIEKKRKLRVKDVSGCGVTAGANDLKLINVGELFLKIDLNKAGVHVYSNVATPLFSPTTHLFLLNTAEINNVLHQQCCTV